MDSTATPGEEWPELHRARRAVLVVDVVESVRLMEHDEAAFIERWLRFVSLVRSQVVASHRGRLVKSLGDGMLIEFQCALPATLAALEIQALSATLARDLAPDELIELRMGVHLADVVADDLDIYGSGVNLSARLAALAGPGEIIVSVDMRDALLDGVQFNCIDLGERFLKHVSHAVRCYRVERVGAGRRGPTLPLPGARWSPVVAVIPFRNLDGDLRAEALGDALADDVIAGLSRARELQVISRLTTQAFRPADVPIETLRSRFGVSYSVQGSYRLEGETARLRVEACDVQDGRVVWADGFDARVSDIFRGQDEAVSRIVASVSREIIDCELARARALPISSLHNYTLYVGSIALLHRLSPPDFTQSRVLLEHLGELHPRSAEPQGLLAKWHVLKALQGWSSDPREEGLRARSFAQRALELDPGHAFSLAMDAIVRAHFDTDLSGALEGAHAAVRSNANEPYGWLVLAGVNSYLERGAEAEECALRARQLSPLDPAAFLFDVFMAAASLSAGKPSDAARWARESIARNAMHPAAHRVLTIALMREGKEGDARQAAQGLLRVDPAFRVGEYARRYPGREQPHAAGMLDALRGAGLPA